MRVVAICGAIAIDFPLVCPILCCINVIFELSNLPTLLADPSAYQSEGGLNNPMMATSGVALPFLPFHVTSLRPESVYAPIATAKRRSIILTELLLGSILV